MPSHKQYLSVGAIAAVGLAAGAAPALATAAPQTVQYGQQTLQVSSGSTVDLNGQQVTLLPGAKRLVVVNPPAGSTNLASTGSPGYQDGSDTDSFSFLPAGSTATTVPSQADPSGISADDAIPGCTLTAHQPSVAGGQAKVNAVSNTNCGGTDTVGVQSSLYWSSSNSPFNWQFQSQSGQSTGLGSATATTSHSCTAGTTHWWHTLNNTEVLDNTTHTQYTDSKNSTNGFLNCT